MSRIPKKSLDIIRERSGGACEVCGKAAGQSHHRRPAGAGGSKSALTHSPSNLLRLCGSLNVTGNCHSFIEHNRTRALADGLLVRQGVDPRTVPVRLRVGLVYLDDDGNYREV